MHKTEQNQISRLEAAIVEAKRFIDRAEAAVEDIRAKDGYYYSTVNTAAAKRASMDLTRALADVRRNRHS